MSSELSPAAEAYVWGFPLLSVHRTRSLFCSRTDTGALNHVDELATPADKVSFVAQSTTATCTELS